LESYEDAAEAARRAGNTRSEARALTGAVAARTHGDTPVPEAISFTDHALERAVDPTTRAFVLQKRARLEAMRGDLETARVFYGECKQLALEYGLRLRRGVQTQDGGAIELMAGDPVAAEQELREGYDVLAELGETGFRSSVAAYLGEALLEQGRLDEAAVAADDAIELAQEDDFDPIARARTVQAGIALERGDLEAATALAETAVALEERSDYIERHADTLVTLARVREAAGNIAEAAVAAHTALELYERKGCVIGAVRARALLDELGLAASAG
jgi:ATP/maltotriose-dependent transcriptional regulator MalT